MVPSFVHFRYKACLRVDLVPLQAGLVVTKARCISPLGLGTLGAPEAPVVLFVDLLLAPPLYV